MAIRSIVWKTLPLWFVIAAGLIALGSVLVTEMRGKGASTATSSDLTDDVVLTGFHLTTTTNGRRTWELTASRARLVQGMNQAILENLQGVAEAGDGSQVEFQGPTGTFDTATRDAVIEGSDGGAIVTLSGTYTVRADRLAWSDRDQAVSSDARVHLTGPRLSVIGTGLRVYPASQEFTLLGDVRAEVF